MMIILIRILIFFLALSSFCLAKHNSTLNIYNWAGLLDPQIVKDFSKKYHANINYDVFDSDYILESKLNLGQNNYDIIVPTLFNYVERYIEFNLYHPIEYTQIPNYQYVDPKIKSLMNFNHHYKFSVPWVWAILSIGYNEQAIKKLNPDFHPENLKHIFNAEKLKTIASCGISMIDSPNDLISIIMISLGKDPNSPNLGGFKKALKILKSIAPLVRNFNSAKYAEELVTGEACLTFGYSGDIITMINKANNPELKFSIPIDGSIIIVDGFNILKDSNNIQLSHQFINYILDPKIAAQNLEYNATFSVIDSIYLPEASQPKEISLITKEYFKKLKIIHKKPQNIENFINFEWQKIMSIASYE